MLTLQRGGKAANDAFARENKNEDDQKVLEDTIMIMAALRKQAPFKGTGKMRCGPRALKGWRTRGATAAAVCVFVLLKTGSAAGAAPRSP